MTTTMMTTTTTIIILVVTKNFLKYIENIALTKSIFRVEQKEVLLQMYHTV